MPTGRVQPRVRRLTPVLSSPLLQPVLLQPSPAGSCSPSLCRARCTAQFLPVSYRQQLPRASVALRWKGQWQEAALRQGWHVNGQIPVSRTLRLVRGFGKALLWVWVESDAAKQRSDVQGAGRTQGCCSQWAAWGHGSCCQLWEHGWAAPVGAYTSSAQLCAHV